MQDFPGYDFGLARVKAGGWPAGLVKPLPREEDVGAAGRRGSGAPAKRE